LKTFRSVKYGSLKKKSPNGNSYRFLIGQDTTAEINGVFYPADEDWMVLLTTHTGGNLLEWTNQPEELVNLSVVEYPEARRVTKLVDTPGFVR